jgi:transcriptional regulator with XRE-family HTH domain
MKKPRNIVGPEIRRIRYQKGITQPQLVAKCNVAGWNISRETLAKIEAQIRWVSDIELLIIAEILGVKLPELFPKPEIRVKALKNYLSD